MPVCHQSCKVFIFPSTELFFHQLKVVLMMRSYRLMWRQTHTFIQHVVHVSWLHLYHCLSEWKALMEQTWGCLNGETHGHVYTFCFCTNCWFERVFNCARESSVRWKYWNLFLEAPTLQKLFPWSLIICVLAENKLWNKSRCFQCFLHAKHWWQ